MDDKFSRQRRHIRELKEVVHLNRSEFPDHIGELISSLEYLVDLSYRFVDFYEMLTSPVLTREVLKQLRESDLSKDEFIEAMDVLKKAMANTDYSF